MYTSTGIYSSPKEILEATDDKGDGNKTEIPATSSENAL